jgi:uncharacterized small protein (DUF1192 family)
MNDLIQLPTVEQINLEHRLANSKASEAVQHATNCGLMLLQVKARLDHGEWLPWLNGEIEAGRLLVKARQATSYMRLASNRQRAADLESPSIRAALELLSDKEPEAQQGTLIDVEAERQAREAAEAKAEAERQAREFAEQQLGVEIQRAGEWKQTAKHHQDIADSIQHELALERQRSAEWKDQWKAEREKKVEPPTDYEPIKAKAAQLESALEALKKEQAKLINSQVKAKLHEVQSEVDEMERRKTVLQEQVDRMKAYMASKDREDRRLAVHQQVIEELRLKLLSLAVFLSDEDPVQDADTLKLWRALADMLAEAMAAVRQYSGEGRPALSMILGEVA